MDILTEIKRDIQAFADPRSTVEIDRDFVYWEMGGREHTATLIQAPGRAMPDIEIDDVTMPYDVFLASPYMADLNRFAEFINKTMPRPQYYVATRGSFTDSARSAAADDLVAGLGTESLPFGSTRIVLVQGEAGSGKTMALRHMTLTRARRYLESQVESLFFYIDVQGRALSRLDDAMARDLQDLRSRFSYGAVPPLVRRGLLVPVIDGFDELLGSGGYDEAFSSLAAFIAQLDGSGSVVASARSAFFDYQNFRENAERFSHDGKLSYEVASVHIDPWTDTEGEDLVRKKADDPAVLKAFREMRDQMGLRNRELLCKPFYVSQIATLLIDGGYIDSDDAILDKLVSTFIEREHAKLRNRDGRPLLSRRGHREFLVQLSQEMWWLETRTLDIATVTAWAELVMEGLSVAPEDAKQIIRRISSYAFFTAVDTAKQTLRFEHEVFYSYFLAERLKRCLDSEPEELRRFLNRSVLDDTLADQTVSLYRGDVEACSDAVEAICAVLSSGVGEGIGRQNGGRLTGRLVKATGGLRPDMEFRNLYFHQEDFGRNELCRPRFYGCQFTGVDLTRARMSSPVFDDCVLQVVKVDPEYTRLQDAQRDLMSMTNGLAIVESDSDGEVVAESRRECYSPQQIEWYLQRLGMKTDRSLEAQPEPQYNTGQRRRIRLIERFLLKMERRFYVSQEDLARFPFVMDEYWDVVFGLLMEHGLLKEEVKQMSGPPKRLLRLGYPPTVIRRGEDTGDASRPAITNFWRGVLECEG